jgi:Ser/Thr protein kinase RdoA (MazF antagonist)/acetylornithine/succinyldiaminopimelate/putrescine aminotransferase
MSDALPELIELPESDLPIESIDEVLREQYGLSGQVFPIEGRDNPYFLIDNGHLRYLLKVTPAEPFSGEIEGEHALMKHVLSSPDGPRIPEPVATRNGDASIVLPLGGEDRRVRLLTFLDGTSPPTDEPLSDEAAAVIGTLSASLTRSIEDFRHPLLDREPQGDLRKAGPQTVSLLSSVSDQQTRDAIAKVMVTALRRIQPLAPGLRIAPSHQNLNAGAVIGEAGENGWLPDGITDFSSIAMGWPVAGLAVTLAWLLENRGGDPFSLLPTIRAYHAADPLSLPELEALWPLVLARTGILAAEAERARADAQDDPHTDHAALRYRNLLERLADISPASMLAAILDCTGATKPLPQIGRLLPDIDPATVRLVDLGIESPLLYGGNWTDPDNDWKLLARIAWETGRASTRYGEYRLSRSSPEPGIQPQSLALHIDVCIPAGTAAVAPFAGKLRYDSDRLALVGTDLTLLVEGLETELEENTELAAGDALGRVAGAQGAVGGLRLQFSRDPDLAPPLFCTLGTAGTWVHLCPSPAMLLGVDADAELPGRPERVVRGWKEYLHDATGRTSLDFSGKAPLVGHGHPRLAAATYRQSLLLDRDLDEPTRDEESLRGKLTTLAPDGLDHVTILPGRLRAVDHAIALARSWTGKRRIITLADDVTGQADPDSLRAASITTAIDMVQNLDDVAAALIDGSDESPGLENLLEALHQKNGLVIFEELGAGYGRLGEDNWNCTHRGLQPDILVCDVDGEGLLGFVMTRAATAISLPPLTREAIPPGAISAFLAKLEIIGDEDLRDNAREIGAHLKTRLQDMSERFATFSRITGSGLRIDLEIPGAAEKIAERLRCEILVGVVDQDTVAIRPPLCLSRASADHFLTHLEQALGQSEAASGQNFSGAALAPDQSPPT